MPPINFKHEMLACIRFIAFIMPSATPGPLSNSNLYGRKSKKRYIVYMHSNTGEERWALKRHTSTSYLQPLIYFRIGARSVQFCTMFWPFAPLFYCVFVRRVPMRFWMGSVFCVADRGCIGNPLVDRLCF
jgi:hypothetical protein